MQDILCNVTGRIMSIKPLFKKSMSTLLERYFVQRYRAHMSIKLIFKKSMSTLLARYFVQRYRAHMSIKPLFKKSMSTLLERYFVQRYRAHYVNKTHFQKKVCRPYLQDILCTVTGRIMSIKLIFKKSMSTLLARYFVQRYRAHYVNKTPFQKKYVDPTWKIFCAPLQGAYVNKTHLKKKKYVDPTCKIFCATLQGALCQ